MIKILIVEDQAILRDALEHLINGQDDMKVAGVTDNASKAPDLCRELKPDLVLMDVVTQDTNGITWAKEILQEMPEIKIVIMTSFPEITFITEARRSGAQSYINKNSGSEHMFYTIRSTMKGVGVYPGVGDFSPFAVQFTEKETDVIRLVCKGKTRAEIADTLSMTEAMVKPIITSILNKTGFDNISKFAIYATSRGLVVPEW